MRWSNIVVMSPRIPPPSMETTRYFAIGSSCKGSGSIYFLAPSVDGNWSRRLS